MNTGSPKGEKVDLEKSQDVSPKSDTSVNAYSQVEDFLSPHSEYTQLQQRFILATVVLTAIVGLITALLFDMHTACSLLVGGFSGALYLRLLGRSIGKLGKGSEKVGKIQLIVPVVLVLAASRMNQLDFFSAMLGFLLYKPAMILHFWFVSIKTARS